MGTLVLTALSLLIATPLGVGAAVFLTEYTKETRLSRFIRTGTETLAGIPSIIFGLFGFAFFVIYLKMGWSILAGALTLACMMLPTIVRTSEEAIRAVPAAYREVSFALGASRWQTVVSVVLPQAAQGIATGIVLATGRAIGETAAVIFTAGSSLRLPKSLMDPVRTLPVHFYILAREGISLKTLTEPRRCCWLQCFLSISRPITPSEDVRREMAEMHIYRRGASRGANR